MKDSEDILTGVFFCSSNYRYSSNFSFFIFPILLLLHLSVILESLETWKQKLSEGEFEELELLLELYSQAQGMEMTAAFVCGFKNGTAMMIEVMVDD